MIFKFKKPSQKTQLVMSKVSLGINLDNDFEKICENKIKKITNHFYGKVTNCGNSAIFIAISSIDGPILIPDQGGWNGFKQIAKFLNKEIITLKTNQGLITTEYLDDTIKNQENLSLILTSFAGYSGEQDIKTISKYCRENNITLIEDASAGIGDDKKRLGNGKYSDIIIASTGSPKIINVGGGGFISSNNSEIFEKTKILQKITKVDKITASGIATEIDFAKANLTKTLKATKYLKNNLKNVIHQNKRGVNVIIKNNNPKELTWKLKKELTIDHKSFITKCPNYNRIKEKAVAIEIKNLDYTSLTKEKLDIIIKAIEKFN